MTAHTANVLMVFFTCLAILAAVFGLYQCHSNSNDCKAGCLKQTNRPVVECYLGCS